MNVIVFCYFECAILVCRKFSVKKSSATSNAQDDTASSASTSTSVGNAPKRQHCDETESANSEAEDRDDGLVHQNHPALMTVWKDPETFCEKLCVCVNLPSGATDIKFTLLGTGPATTSALISYIWTETIYTVEGMFGKEMKSNSLSPTHLLIMGLKHELENNRPNIVAKPKGCIRVALPIPVQIDSTTVAYKAGKSPNGLIVLIAHLSAFHNCYTKSKAEFDCKFVDF